MKSVFRNFHLYDPSVGLDGLGDILVENRRILKISKAPGSLSAESIIDGHGKHLFPGFVDIHVHFRDPGDPHKETIESGALAAVAGGFTSVCMMANTRPVNDNAVVTRYMLERAQSVGKLRIFPISAATINLDGEKMVEYQAMLEAGCVAVSDDGRCVMNAHLARKIMEYLKDFDLPFIEHCEDCNLSCSGAMNEGATSFKKGLKGVPSASEDVIVTRDIILSKMTGGRLHLAHLSTKGSVGAVRTALSEGVRVSAEVTPHHLFFSDEELNKNLDANFKMAPPLRSEEDRRALLAGINDGVIQAIATDHAPHSREEKNLEFGRAPNGVIGLETAFAVCNTLVERGELRMDKMIQALTCGPAKIMKLKDLGQLREGYHADFSICDLKMKTEVPGTFFSKSQNSPFIGCQLSGKVLASYLGGQKVFEVSERGATG